MVKDSTHDAYRSMVERLMKEFLAPSEPALSAHHSMMHYHLGWADQAFRDLNGSGGKRLRPVLCLLACDAAGGDVHQALPAAAAIEILHNFSLVHDDVEDNSPTRRGRATVWQLWGVPQAVNVGDALFSYAHLTLSRLREVGVPNDQIVAAVRAFDETCVALTEGQFLDMSFENRLDVTVEEYMTMIELKTGVLMGLSAELGALLAEASTAQVAQFRSFGRSLGLAFQIEDDILGIWGDETATGKSVASDILERKKTLPVIYGLRSDAGQRLATLYSREELTSDDVTAVVGLLDEFSARDHAQQMADQALADANSALDATLLPQQSLKKLVDLAAALRRRPS